MTRLACVCAAALLLQSVQPTRAQSVYPTGTTIYDPDRAWNGYTVLSPLGTRAVLVIDMNGNVVKRWEDYNNSAGGPARVLPGGSVIAASGARPPHQESLELVQRDFAGNDVWRFSRNEQITTREGATIWSARQHHDWQRESFPAGYYSPESTPVVEGGTTLVLTHTNRTQPAVADVLLEDDRLIEVSWSGDILWEWVASDHIDELGFSADARKVIQAAAGLSAARGSFDWLHLNSATYLGPNRWFDQGDARFAPNNVIVSSREASLLAIVGRDGRIVWRLGPDFSQSGELRAIRQIIGQHHAHLIPKGLPGAGNLLVFDNGGSSGYGFANPIAPDGTGAFARATSRVLEIDPVTLELVWSYTNPRFFSSNISSAQRLPNGNTLITAGAGGRLFEVTRAREIVWEYLYPVFGGPTSSNAVYRAYRIPYGWIPQLTTPAEQRVTPPPLGDFRVGATSSAGVRDRTTTGGLPLDNLGLEHLDIVAPDPAASARFYARIFRSALHQQPVRDTLRYFVLLGDLPADRQVGYLAIGAAGGRAPAIGHYCVLAKAYDRAGVAGELQAAGYGVATAGPTGMWPDPDRLQLQLFQPPAGLVAAAVPSPLPVEHDGLLTPRGVDHVLLRVSSLEKSLPYYRLVFGTAAERPRDGNGRVWFHLERNTRLGLEEAAAGQAPAIAHYAIKVAPFDRGALEARLRELGTRALAAADEADVVRFADNNGIVAEVRVAE